MKRITLAFAWLFAAAAISVAADNTATDADNSAKNERDRSNQTLTSGDQSNSREDIKITQQIRQAVIKSDSLSITAKNIKIITIGGKVTLRGPVKDAEEKRTIDKLAKSIAGEANVDDQIESNNSH